jgi:hypothetical protein
MKISQRVKRKTLGSQPILVLTLQGHFNILRPDETTDETAGESEYAAVS